MLKFFRSSANQRLVGRLLRELFRKHAPTYGVAIVAMLVVAATTAGSAWIMRDVTNEFVVPKDIDSIYLIAGAVAAIFIIKGIATYVQALFLSRAGNASSPSASARSTTACSSTASSSIIPIRRPT